MDHYELTMCLTEISDLVILGRQCLWWGVLLPRCVIILAIVSRRRPFLGIGRRPNLSFFLHRARSLVRPSSTLIPARP